jgi:hypothetical protein
MTPNLTEGFLSKKRIIFCGHFDGFINAAKLKFFLKLAELAQKESWQILFVDHGLKSQELYSSEKGFDRLLNFARRRDVFNQFFMAALNIIRFPQVSIEALTCEYMFDRRFDLDSFLGIGGIFKWINSQLHLSKDDVIILWGAYLPFHRVVRVLGESVRATVICAEYGSLPGHVVFEESGINAESWPVSQSALFKNLPIDEHDLEFARQYIKSININRRSMKDYVANDGLVTIRKDRRSKVFVVGSELFASGIVPRMARSSKLLSPFFENNRKMLDFVVSQVKKDSWLILYKDHPNMASFPLSGIGDYDQSNVYVLGKIDIHDILDHSDVVVTLGSSVAQLSLIRDKPCVLLGRNAMYGKGCCYQVGEQADIADIIATALDVGLTAQQKLAFCEYVARELKYHMFALTETDRQFCSRGPEDLFDLIKRYMIGKTNFISFDDTANPSTQN